MPRDESPSNLSDCLSHAELVAYNLGKLAPRTVEAVAVHLAHCPKCESSLLELHEESDTFLLNLRRCRGEATFATVLNTPGAGRAWPREGRTFPQAFGSYELLAELGRGGMGIVFQARQRTLNRLVALKMIRGGDFATPRERRRFRIEAEAIARLRHPNAVQVHEFGEYDGLPYFSMEYLEGGTLARKLAEGPLAERGAAEIVQTLARAVHAAHQRQIVHRDLKPANVLLTADGTPKVTDFGLAKLLDAEGTQTHGDGPLGTPSYMAPEQARGGSWQIGPAADVYALGAILYETLTGRPPFKGASRTETLEQVQAQEPARPSRLRPGVSPGLEAICLACLEKEPARRYASAAALADDLERWLRGDTPRVRPAGLLKRAWRAVRRHPAWSAAAALLLVALVSVPLAAYHLDPDRSLKDIESQLERGETVTLIGDTGGPRWSRWCLGGEAAQVTAVPEEVFTVYAWGQPAALLELVRSPRRSYRLSAEVRHEKSAKGGSVGIYFAHRAHHHGVHYCCLMRFNDLMDEKERHTGIADHLTKLSPKGQGISLRPPPQGNKVILSPHLFAEGLANSAAVGLGIRGLPPGFFTAAGYRGETWRKLVVEVTPEEVRGFWEGTSLGGLPVAEVLQNTKDALTLARKRRPDDPAARGVEPEFTPLGSLGIFVLESTASFRRVTVEPLEAHEH